MESPKTRRGEPECCCPRPREGQRAQRRGAACVRCEEGPGCEADADEACPGHERLANAAARREAAAHYQLLSQDAAAPPCELTSDERSFPRYAASFNKLLEHEPATGLLTAPDADGLRPQSGVDNYRRLLCALGVRGVFGCRDGCCCADDLDRGALAGVQLASPPDEEGLRRVLINPVSGFAYATTGRDPEWLVRLFPAELLSRLDFSSVQTAAEMLEVYAMAILRDLPVASYATSADPDVALVLAALNAVAPWLGAPLDGGAVTGNTLFRGRSSADLVGGYLSAFFTLPRPPLFPSGCAPFVADLIGAGEVVAAIPALLRFFEAPVRAKREFGVSFEDYVAIQNGAIPLRFDPAVDFDPGNPVKAWTPANVTGRDLGSYVHVDAVAEPFLWATDVLTGGAYPRSPVSPYAPGPGGSDPLYQNQGDGPTLGPPDAWSLVLGVAAPAMRAAWLQKWRRARRARPEVFAALLHQKLNGSALPLPIDARLEVGTGGPIAQLLQRVRTRNQAQAAAFAPAAGSGDTYLLGQMFPEGSPGHPAWPSGHATYSGACATIIKAFFDETRFIRDPSAPAGPPVPYTPDGVVLHVGRELDKMASNVALARNFAGVHFRSDGEDGILLGEEVAIHVLQDQLRIYRERFRAPRGAPAFELTRRSGVRIRITADDVCEIEPAELEIPEAVGCRKERAVQARSL